MPEPIDDLREIEYSRCNTDHTTHPETVTRVMAIFTGVIFRERGMGCVLLEAEAGPTQESCHSGRGPSRCFSRAWLVVIVLNLIYNENCVEYSR